jgi:DNA invertase Pin-like site-specific DNA recombinase
MSSAVHGYIRRGAPGSTGHSADARAQQAAIRDYCHNRLLSDGGPSELEPRWYIDVAAAGQLKLGDREAGRVLLREARRGDHVIITSSDRAFSRLRDFVAVLDLFNRLGVRFHLVDLAGEPVDLSKCRPEYMVKFLAPFGELERAWRAEIVGSASRDRRGRGLGLGRWPRLGFKYVSVRTPKDGRKRLKQVPDPEERQLMKRIVAFRREDHWSWSRIREQLDDEQIRTRSGTPWTVSRLRRAARAEVLLEAIEAAGCPDTFAALELLSRRTAASDEGRDEPAGSG